MPLGDRAVSQADAASVRNSDVCAPFY